MAKIFESGDAAGGTRPMDLFPTASTNETVRDMLLKTDAHLLFPNARDAESALSGLFLYFSCLKEAHDLLHTFGGIDGAYWHGIMHRMEGDSYNVGYWFRRIAGHPMFPVVQREAAALGYKPGEAWDPFAFAVFCEASAQAKPSDRDLAKRVQLAEWQVLFDYCAAPVHATTVHANTGSLSAPGATAR